MKIIIIICALVLFVSNAIAEITFPYSTTYDCSEQDQFTGGWPNCDNTESSGTWGWIDVALTDGSANQWSESSAPNEWYYTGSDISAEPRELLKSAVLQGHGAIGSLIEGQWVWGDNDTLGSDTVYVYSVVDPDSQAVGYVTANAVHTTALAGDFVTQITTVANNPLGSGRGLRFWLGDGSIVNTPPIGYHFQKQTELWIRWYQRYEVGFGWDDLTTDKTLYIYTTGGTSQYVAFKDWTGDTFSVVAQGTSNAYQLITADGDGWTGTMGGSTSDGEFHCYEIYLKMDTDQTDGAGRIWIDGVLKAENTAMDWSNGAAASKEGWTRFKIKTNSDSPGNGEPMYVDYDNLKVENTTPAGSCDDGAGGTDPCIGPIPVVVGQAPVTSSNTGAPVTSSSTGAPWVVGN